jgi:hypothetical protein
MLTLLPRACPLLQQMTEMRPKKESKSNAPPKALVNDEEEGVAKAAAGKDEQPELRKYKWLAALFMSAFLVSISANAGLTIAIVTKTVGTHTQTHVYAVSLTSARLDSAGESVVAKVPCVEVAEAIVSIQNGDADQGLVMIPLGDGEFSTPSRDERSTLPSSRGLVRHGADLPVRRSQRVVQRVVRDLDGGLRDPPRPPLRRSALGGHRRFERSGSLL